MGWISRLRSVLRGDSVSESLLTIESSEPSNGEELLEVIGLDEAGLVAKDLLGLTNVTTQSVNSASQNMSDADRLSVASALGSIYSQVDGSRKEFLQEFEPIRTYYLVDAIFSTMAQDALTPDITSGDILNITSKNPKINEDLRALQSNFDFDNIISDIINDILTSGEYALRLEVEAGKGVIGIHDDVVMSNIVAFYRQGHPMKFLVKDGKSITLSKPYKYAHFMLSGSRLRLDIEKFVGRIPENLRVELNQLARFARVGRPLLYGTLSKIRELQLLEQLVPSLKLSEVSKGSVVGIDVPPNTEPKHAFDIARQYEQLFNKKLTIDKNVGRIQIADIINVAGRVKVVPTYGGKGTLSPIDAGADSNLNDIVNSIRDNREIICTSAGIPPELVFGGASASEIGKRYVRYVRKIKAIQQAVANGVVQICMAHFNNLTGHDPVNPSDFIIRFRNEAVNVDELEKLEFYDAIVGMTKSTFELVEEMLNSDNSHVASAIDLESYKAWATDRVNYFINANLSTNSREGDNSD